MTWGLRFLVPGVLAGAPRPPSGHLGPVLSYLRMANIGAVVNVHELPLVVPQGCTLDVMHDATEDYEAPSHLLEVCTFINTARRRGDATVVSCGAGLGRTGTVLAAWLIFARHIAASDAIIEVRAAYDCSAVESQAQIDALEVFARQRGVAVASRSIP